MAINQLKLNIKWPLKIRQFYKFAWLGENTVMQDIFTLMLLEIALSRYNKVIF